MSVQTPTTVTCSGCAALSRSSRSVSKKPEYRRLRIKVASWSSGWSSGTTSDSVVPRTQCTGKTSNSRSSGSWVSARKISWSPACRQASITSRMRGIAASQRGEARFPCLQNPLSTSTTIVTLRRLGHHLEPGVRPVAAADLGAGPALDHDHVGGVVVGPLEEGASHAIGIHRNPLTLEALDFLDIEAAAGDDLHVLEALAVESPANQVAELRVDSTGVEVTHQFLDADVDHGLRGVEADAPQPILERPGHLE